MILLFGKDIYRINKELKKLAVKPIVFDFTEEEVKLKEIIASLEGDSLFGGEARPVVLKNIFSGTNKDTKEKLAEIVDLPSAQKTILVEYGVPDKRVKLYKTLQQKAQSVELNNLQDFELKNWINEFVTVRQGSLEPSALNKLAFEIGPDLYRMEQELNKLLSYASSIKLETVEKLVQNRLEDDIFLLTDAISLRQKPRALKLLADQIKAGQNELYLLSMLAFAFRNLLLVKELSDQGRSQTDISSVTKIHPFVVGKALTQTKQFNLESLKKIYLKLVDLDEAIKIGKIEARQGLELLILGS